MAQVNAVSETILHQMPRGTEPPQITHYNAANVPVAQLNVYSDALSGEVITAPFDGIGPVQGRNPF